MEPDVVYFGIEIKPGKTVHLGTAAGAGDDDDDDGVSLVHATQVALGPDPAPGRHTVFAVQDGARTPVGTLQAGVCEQFTLDLMWSALAGVPGAAVAFAHSGASPVYVSGYKTVTSLLDDASDGGEPGSDEFESDDDESEESSEEEEEEAGARQAVKVSWGAVCLWRGRPREEEARRRRGDQHASRRLFFCSSRFFHTHRPTAACATLTCRPTTTTRVTAR